MSSSKKIISALCVICTILACTLIAVIVFNDTDRQSAQMADAFDEGIQAVSNIEQAHASLPPLTLAETFRFWREADDIDVNEVALMRNFHFDVPEEFLTSISGIYVEHDGDTLTFRTWHTADDNMLYPRHLLDRALNHLAAMLVETGQLPAHLAGRELMSWLYNRGVEISYFNMPFRPFPFSIF